MVHSLRRLVRSLKTHGFSGTWERAFRKAPSVPVVRPPEVPHVFDQIRGTDTGGFLPSSSLTTTSLSNVYSNGYVAIAPSALVQAISDLPLQPERFTFVDLGCGKGRALLIAAEFRFRSIVGVEFAPELCRIATENVRTSPESNRMTILNRDAATYTYPDTPLIIFLYNPFLAPVLRRVLANLERQLRKSPRETYLLYAQNPRFTKVLSKFPFLRELSEKSYEFSPDDAAAHPFRLTR
jgi:SAM-dependent methyltransferase